MTVEVSTDPAALATLAPAWRALWERDPSATLFHTPEYARVAWETELGADRDLVVTALNDGGELTGLAAWTIDPDETLRFLGNAEVTDYLGPVAVPDARERFAGAVLEEVVRLESWTRAELLCLAGDTGWPELLARAAKAAGLTVSDEQHDVCPRVALTGDHDAYLASLPQKLRHEIRRKERRLDREAGGYRVRLSTPDTLAGDLEAFFEMHRGSQGQKGKFMHDDMAELFRRLAGAFEPLGWLRLLWIESDAGRLAATLSFVERGVWSVYNSAFDHARREWGPGMVSMSETIRCAAAEGCHTVDFLRGDEPYKYRLGAVDTPLHRLTLTR